MMPFITRRRHDAEMAKVRAEERDKWYKIATRIEDERDELRARCRTLQARLDALTPARGQGGRFVGKVGSHGTAYSERYNGIGNHMTTPPETTA